MILSAELRLKDGFSGVFSKAHKDTNQFNSKLKLIGGMVVKPVVRLKDETAATLGKIKSGLTSIQGMAAIGLGAIGMSQFGTATIGAAASTEMQLETMQAVLRDQQKARDYMAWTMKESADTMFKDTEMMTAALSLTPYAKESISDFKEMMRTAEVLASINPLEGMEGGAFALREAMSGDFVSLQERFNLPRSVINDLKEGKTTAKEYLQVVQKAAESLGFTYELVEKQGRTSIGYWNKITGNISSSFRSLGSGMLESIKPRLEKISDWFDNNEDKVAMWKSNIIQFGKQGVESLLSAFENTFTHIKYRYLENEEFKNMSFSAKIDFVMADISAGFNSWYDSGGREKVQAFGQTIGEGLKAGLLQVAPTIGSALGQTILSTFTAALQSSPIGAIIMGAIPGAAIGSVLPGVGTVLGAGAGAGAGLFTWGVSKIVGGGNGHASGLPYVPYDNYLTRLHKGERVLTAADNRQYSNSSRLTLPNVTININGADKSPRAIAKEVMNELFNELRSADMNMPAAVTR